MALILSAEEIRRSIGIGDAIDVLEDAYRQEAAGAVAVADRINLMFDGGWLRLMSAAMPGLGVVGYKEFHLVGTTVRYQISLVDIDTGELLAILDGDYITVLRTAATAGVAARRLAPAAHDLAVIGSGAEARMQAMVMCHVLDVRQMSVYSRSADRRDAFVKLLSDQLEPRVYASPSGTEAVAEADLVIVATNTAGTGPALFADWLPDRAHISSIGSTMPAQRELDADVWRYPELVVVDTMQVLDESGDAIEAARAGTLDRSNVISLAELCADPASGTTTTGRTLYKSVGSPVQDVAVAAHAYRRASGQGLGTVVSEFHTVKSTQTIGVT